jgi:hypothetical protein
MTNEEQARNLMGKVRPAEVEKLNDLTENNFTGTLD